MLQLMGLVWDVFSNTTLGMNIPDAQVIWSSRFVWFLGNSLRCFGTNKIEHHEWLGFWGRFLTTRSSHHSQLYSMSTICALKFPEEFVRALLEKNADACLRPKIACLFDYWFLLVCVGIPIWSVFVIGALLDLTPSIGAPWSYYQSSFMYLDNSRYLYNTPNSESWFWLILSFKTNGRSLWNWCLPLSQSFKNHRESRWHKSRESGLITAPYYSPPNFGSGDRHPRIPMWNERMDGPPWELLLGNGKTKGQHGR